MEILRRIGEGARTRREYAETLIRSLGIAFVLLLHLAMLCWITLPVTPLQQSFKPIDRDMAMDVRLLKAQHRTVHNEQAAPPLPPSPLQVRSVQRKVARSAPSVASKPPEESVSNIPQPVPSEPASSDAPPAEPEAATPYGNSRFSESLQSSQGSGVPQIPGEGEPVRVSGIHVESAPSVAQVLRSIGHTLRCKDALAKSRMATDRGDAELLQRGMTYQQAMLEWKDLHCQ
jgi:hypothetical protein